MDGTVRERQNHYETLGVKPTASDQQIRQGFARAMRMPHRLAEVAHFGVAFNTLGSPAKRRAYDEALGLIPEAEAQSRVAPSAISFQISGHFAGSVAPHSGQPKAEAAAAPGEPPSERQPKPDRRPEDSTWEGERVWPERRIPEFLVSGQISQPSTRLRKERVVDWKYPAFAFGSVVLSVAVIGAWAGANAENVPPKSAEATLTVPLPPAESNSHTVDVPTSSSSGTAEPEFVSPALIERARQRVRARAAARSLARSATVSQGSASDASGATDPTSAAMAAKLPLPGAVIARTIERIGYACGAIASATAIGENEPGAYRVTCTSGQSYRGTPVHGRYHFRRW